MLVYRIEKKKHRDTWPPKGSLFANGRWNTRDMWVVYTSESIALAKLEALANCGPSIPENRFLLTLEVAEDSPMAEILSEDLPQDWWSVPYPRELSSIIKEIMNERKYVGVIVPSAQSPRERNLLLLPDHPDFNRYVTRKDDTDEFFDPRLK